MQFSLTEDQAAIQETARRFSIDRVLPGYMARAETAELDFDLIREMAALGLVGAELPEEFGGSGVDGVTSGVITEQIAYGDPNFAYVPIWASLLGGVIRDNANPDLKAYWLPRIIAGDAIVGVALTEPRGGSDAANLAVRAERDGDQFVLNGEKTSISGATQVQAIVLFARTGDRDSGPRGVSAFLVPMDLDGISTSRFNDVGTHIVGRGSIFFDNVRIPTDNLLGAEGGGFGQVMRGFDFSRGLIGLQAVAAAQASLDETWQYVTEREAFGAPLARYQGVSFPLAEYETMVNAARLICYQCLDKRDRGLPHTSEAAQAKWLGPKVAMEAIHQCLLSHGHSGYSMDLPHQQRLRDVMGLEIGDGTAQIMKLIVAREKVGRIAVQYDKGIRD
jgi:cyclohexanecarboxyl-CoA dehydrogenase